MAKREEKCSLCRNLLQPSNYARDFPSFFSPHRAGIGELRGETQVIAYPGSAWRNIHPTPPPPLAHHFHNTTLQIPKVETKWRRWTSTCTSPPLSRSDNTGPNSYFSRITMWSCQKLYPSQPSFQRQPWFAFLQLKWTYLMVVMKSERDTGFGGSCSLTAPLRCFSTANFNKRLNKNHTNQYRQKSGEL